MKCRGYEWSPSRENLFRIVTLINIRENNILINNILVNNTVSGLLPCGRLGLRSLYIFVMFGFLAKEVQRVRVESLQGKVVQDDDVDDISQGHQNLMLKKNR